MGTETVNVPKPQGLLHKLKTASGVIGKFFIGKEKPLPEKNFNFIEETNALLANVIDLDRHLHNQNAGTSGVEGKIDAERIDYSCNIYPKSGFMFEARYYGDPSKNPKFASPMTGSYGIILGSDKKIFFSITDINGNEHLYGFSLETGFEFPLYKQSDKALVIEHCKEILEKIKNVKNHVFSSEKS